MPTHDPHPFLSEGMEVLVVRGPLAGTRGRLLRKDRVTRMVLAVTLIRQAATVEIHPDDITPVGNDVAPENETPLGKDRTWFYSTMFFLPREIRSPALDHVLEDRERLAAEGYSRWFIDVVTLSQCGGLLLCACWSLVRDLLSKRPRVSRGP